MKVEGGEDRAQTTTTTVAAAAMGMTTHTITIQPIDFVIYTLDYTSFVSVRPLFVFPCLTRRHKRMMGT